MSSAFDDIMEGLAQAARHAAGEDVRGILVHVPETLDVASIRKSTGLSQENFARSIGVKTTTLRQWEQGRRQPDGPARVLLSMVERRPTVVMETLGMAVPASQQRTSVRKQVPAIGKVSAAKVKAA